MPCDHCSEGEYPNYGVAPHGHDLSGGSFIGSTRLIPKDKWPANFVPDPEDDSCGMYYCPKCMDGMPARTG